MKRYTRLFAWLLVGMSVALFLGCPQDAPPQNDNATAPGEGGDDTAEDPPAVAAAKQAWEYLLTMYNKKVEDPRHEKLGWGPEAEPFHVGINALLCAGLMESPWPRDPSQCGHTKGTLEAILNYQDSNDGAFISAQGGSAVYETAACIYALSTAVLLSEEWAAREDVQEAIQRGRDYLLVTQIDETPEPGVEDVVVEGPDDELGAWYGGWSYGRGYNAQKAPANLSTTNIAAWGLARSVEAIPPGGETAQRVDAAWNRLHNFLQNCQNLEENQSEGGQETRWSQEADPNAPMVTQYGTDGGAMYAPGYSKAGYEEGQGELMVPESYGSMTYALLRCYHLAGLPADDPRVQAAAGWLSQAENFEFAHNPGMPQERQLQGHFYYLMTAAEALSLQFPDGTLTDSAGEEHNWHAVIRDTVLGLQTADGHWINEADRWEEDQPVLVTAYALLTLGKVGE